MGFLNFLKGASNVVSGIAKALGGTSIGSGIGKVANILGTATSIAGKVMPYVSTGIQVAKTIGDIAYKTGIGDKLTNGKFSNFYKGVQSMFGSLPKGTQQNNSATTRTILNIR